MKSRLKKKLAIFLSVAMFLISPGFCTYISEINFGDLEFIEIYSSTMLNLSESLLHDEGGFEKANTLYHVKIINNSFFYLIVGYDFLSNYNISGMNCSIYKTGKSNLGYYNLNNVGENITLIVNETLNLSWSSEGDLVFSKNESLHLDEFNNSLIDNFSFCSFNSVEIVANISENDGLENNSYSSVNISSGNVSMESAACQAVDFEIDIFDGVYEDKVEFDFETNVSDYKIEYWVEDYLHTKILKNKRNTTSLSTKTYTPQSTGFYWINSILHYGNCSKNASVLALFYSEPDIGEDLDYNAAGNFGDVIKNKSSYITILNSGDIISGNSDELIYEIYRGDTSKRAVYFYLNGDKFFTDYVNKYEKSSGRLLLNPSSGNNSIFIDGLEISSNLSFKVNYLQTQKVDKSNKSNFVIDDEKDYFDLKNISINENEIVFRIDSNINFTSWCYVNYIRTTISEKINLSSSGDYSLEINNSELKEKEILDIYPIKLLCKYKKEKLKSVYYESFELNYTINDKNRSVEFFENQQVVNGSSMLGGLNGTSNFFTFVEKNSFKNNINSKAQFNNSGKINQNYSGYVSKSEKLKEESYFPAFAGVVVLFSAFLIRW